MAERKVAENVVAPRVIPPAAAGPAAPAPCRRACRFRAKPWTRIASRHGLPPELIHSVIQVESNYNPYAVSPKGALGMMQLIPATARRFGVTDVFDPVENIQGGAKYLQYLLDLYDGNYPLALAAYNAGENAVAKYGTVPPYPETQNYLKLVAKRLEEAQKAAEPRKPRNRKPSRRKLKPMVHPCAGGRRAPMARCGMFRDKGRYEVDRGAGGLRFGTGGTNRSARRFRNRQSPWSSDRCRPAWRWKCPATFISRRTACITPSGCTSIFGIHGRASAQADSITKT